MLDKNKVIMFNRLGMEWAGYHMSDIKSGYTVYITDDLIADWWETFNSPPITNVKYSEIAAYERNYV